MAVQSQPGGSEALDNVIFQHLAQETVTTHGGEAVTLGSRRGQRLLRECVRLGCEYGMKKYVPCTP